MKRETKIEGGEVGCLLSEASHLVGLARPLSGLCSGPCLSPNPECVWFFSCDKSWIPVFFFLFFGCSPLQLLMARVWAGLVWFLVVWVQALTELVGSGCEAVAGRQVVLVKLAVWLIDVFSFGQSRVCFKTFAIATTLLHGQC